MQQITSDKVFFCKMTKFYHVKCILYLHKKKLYEFYFIVGCIFSHGFCWQHFFKILKYRGVGNPDNNRKENNIIIIIEITFEDLLTYEEIITEMVLFESLRYC